MTQLRQKMLEELQRRNYSDRTAKTYVRIVRDFAAAEPTASSSRPLRHSRRWTLARPHPLDPSSLPILPARPRTQSRLPRQVRRRLKTPIPATPTHFRGISSTLGQPKGVPLLLTSIVP